jgi:hypothetical protein
MCTDGRQSENLKKNDLPSITPPMAGFCILRTQTDMDLRRCSTLSMIIPGCSYYHTKKNSPQEKNTGAIIMSYGITIEENSALADETLIAMRAACSEFPVKISRACLERLIRKGTRGVRLETIFIANRRYTSREAIRRFIERSQNAPHEMSAPTQGATSGHAPSRPTSSKPSAMTTQQLETARKKFLLPTPGSAKTAR